MADKALDRLKLELKSSASSAEVSLLCKNESRRIFKTQVPSKHIEHLWKRCRDLFHETGFWPVATWEHEFFHLGIHGIRTESELLEILQRGDSFDLEEWFLREQNYWKQGLDGLDLETYEAELADKHGDWPEEKKSWYKWGVPDFLQHFDSTKGDAWILFVEAEECWHVPAVLGVPWFGWPNRPNEPEIHVGMLKYLHYTYGAELRTLGTQWFTVKVARCPDTIDAAMKLAHRFNLYSSDLIDEVVDSFEQLATTLISTPDWFFWWD